MGGEKEINNYLIRKTKTLDRVGIKLCFEHSFECEGLDRVTACYNIYLSYLNKRVASRAMADLAMVKKALRATIGAFTKIPRKVIKCLNNTLN